MSTIIKYNNMQIGPPTPLVTLDREHSINNNKLGDIDRINLIGQLTGNFSELISGQNNLLNKFSSNFKNFEIYEDNNLIYIKSGIIINSVNFSEAKYHGIVDYEISLTAKKFNFDVQNPVDQFNISKENGTLTLSHRVAAQGINTSTTNTTNSLQNAINFVNQFTGLNNLPSLYVEDTLTLPVNNSIYHLLEVRESINRLDGSYSIEESYIKDLNFDADQSGILRYSIDVNSGSEQNNISFTIKGNYSNSPINGDFNFLRNRFINVIKPSLANKIIDNISGFYSGYVNSNPINYSINENSGAHNIDFQFEYDNLNLPNPYVLYTSNVSRDEISQIISININAEIIARGGLSNRYSLAQNYVSQVGNSMFNLAKNIYNTFININDYKFNFPLRFVKSNRKDNQFLGKILLSYSYDDKEVPGLVADANYTVNQQLPVWYFSANPTLSKNTYIFQDFDIRTPLRSTYDADFRFNQSLNLKNDEIARGMVDPIINSAGQEIKNEKISVQKNKDGSLRSVKVTKEIISTTTGAFLPKSI